jgi:hypothetical protein
MKKHSRPHRVRSLQKSILVEQLTSWIASLLA